MDSLDASLLIQGGSALYIIAFLIREELIMRLTVIAGTVLYILYYFLFPDPPLWDAIIASVIMIIANFVVLGQIVLERTTFRLTADEKEMFSAFETLTPGQFRHVLKLADWKIGAEGGGTVLTNEGQPCQALFFIFKGDVQVDKSGKHFPVPSGNFIGEIAYILETNPTATTTASGGVRYVEWNAVELRKISTKRPTLGNALNALLTRDLARKLSTSYQIDPSLIPAADL